MFYKLQLIKIAIAPIFNQCFLESKEHKDEMNEKE